ncbi:MAG: hypothetical protein HKL87_04530 [Acidimicrobiaceae bacterium]|nr:hypothetical protein [Acidimicrobiaceae bacterium]
MREEEVRQAQEGESLRGQVTTADRVRAVLLLILVEAVCGLAFYFELHRAESGNALSWAYVFEWPLLGIVAIYMMWKFTHPDTINQKKKPDKPLDPEFESMRQAWEESQSRLATSRVEDVNGEVS